MWIRSGSEIGALFMAAALLVPVDRAEMTRALELARWPHTDQERARFHGRYIVHTGGAAVNQLSVTSIEVITEFRRMELIAEAHARLNDNFARGGAIREAEQALEPWRGRLSIVAHVDASQLSFGVPDVRVDIAGRDAPPPID